MPSQICDLIRVLLLSFLRGSEDTFLPTKPRKKLINTMPNKNNKVIAEVEPTYRDEHFEEKIDSNVLWAFLSYCAHSNEHIDAFLCIIQGQTLEFTKKCSRLLH